MPGFLVKDTALDDILAAIRVVAAGNALIAPSVTRRLPADRGVRWAASPPRRQARSAANRRHHRPEREILTLVGRGPSNTEIAAEPVIGVATLKTDLTRLHSELDARDRAQLVIVTYETDLVTPPR